MNILFIKQNFYFQPLTSIFIHGGILHPTMNIVVLYQFWTLLQYKLSSLKLFLIFIIGGIIVSLLSFLYTYMFNAGATTLGASGAISIFIEIMAYIYKQKRVELIVFMIIISFASILFSINIAWYAHMFGFILGFLWSYLFL